LLYATILINLLTYLKIEEVMDDSSGNESMEEDDATSVERLVVSQQRALQVHC